MPRTDSIGNALGGLLIHAGLKGLPKPKTESSADMFTKSVGWYDAIYSWKEYERETGRLRLLIGPACTASGYHATGRGVWHRPAHHVSQSPPTPWRDWISTTRCWAWLARGIRTWLPSRGHAGVRSRMPLRRRDVPLRVHRLLSIHYRTRACHRVHDQAHKSRRTRHRGAVHRARTF